MKNDEEVLKDLEKFIKDNTLNVSKEQMDSCLEAVSKLPNNHGKYSKKSYSADHAFFRKGGNKKIKQSNLLDLAITLISNMKKSISLAQVPRSSS